MRGTTIIRISALFVMLIMFYKNLVQPLSSLYSISTTFHNDEPLLHGCEANKTKEMKHRSDRFPSIEQRVQIYMSDWYKPPCFDRKPNIHFRTHKTEDTKPMVQVSVFEGLDFVPSEMNISADVTPDSIFMMDKSSFIDCGKPGRFGMHLYCNDVIDIGYTNSIVETPLLFHFGDQIASLNFGLVQVPHFKKFRASTSISEIERITYGLPCQADSINDWPRIQTTYDENTAGKKYFQPIILKLETDRHYGPVGSVQTYDIPWDMKKDMAVFRGALTGYNKLTENIDVSNSTALCLNLDRCRLVLAASSQAKVDAKLTTLQNVPLPTDVKLDNRTISIMDKSYDIKKLLEYKAIIMVDGNDVASGYKWSLYSKSVVMMQPPKLTTWAMEELLEPWKVSF